MIFVGIPDLDPLSECVLKTENEPYTGTVSITNNGIPCQAWASSYPQQHSRNKNRYFPTDGSVHAAKNYCRSFGDLLDGIPLCFTTHPDILWGKCALRICNGKSEV